MTQPASPASKAPTATIETSEGNITVEFWPDVAPNHVNNFLELGRKGFYNGTIFHRVIPGFMIQGGDPTGTGTGSNGNTRLKAEFNRRPDRKHARGVLSMARSQSPDSASCQFFIMHQDSPHLDGQYSAFGKVTSGIETVDKIVSVPTGANDRPKNPPKILKITVNE
jgi:peptidyl-prolyl cis-trans isomerase B (cyclophilin B)